MPKHARDAGSEPAKAASRPNRRERAALRRSAHRRARLEEKLAAADRLVVRRTEQLTAANARRSAIAAKLALAVDASTGAGGHVAVTMAYCLKDRRQVRIAGAEQVVLPNGRTAVRGTCPSCGSSVLRMGTGVAQPA